MSGRQRALALASTATVTVVDLLSCSLFRRLYNQDRARSMSDDGIGGRAKKESSQSGATMRRDDNQINLAFPCYPHDLGSRFSVHNQLLHRETGALITFRQFWQFSLCRILQPLRNISDRKMLSHPVVPDSGDHR